MDFEFAEAPAEFDLLRIGEMLIAEYDHAAIVKQIFYLTKGRVIDRLRQIDPSDLSSERRVGVLNPHI